MSNILQTGVMHCGTELRGYGTDADIIAAARQVCEIFPMTDRYGNPTPATAFDGITSANEIHMDDDWLRLMMGAITDIVQNRKQTTDGGYYDHRWEDDRHDRYMVEWYRKHGAKSDATR